MAPSNPKVEHDLELLVEQLASDESVGNLTDDSTVKELRLELETLANDLRRPPPADRYEQESAFQRGLDLVKALGRDPTFVSASTRPGESSMPADLGTIREYKLLAKLGEGGMGAVYKALHRRLDKVVALKILPADRMQNTGAVQRFEREMKAVGKLDHPNIVRAMDAGENEGTHYLVMELVDGVDLSELLRRVGPVAAADACELVRQAASGLQHAHQRGLVHRDIKPSNIMLSWSDEYEPGVKILDMGLALLSESMTPAHVELTTTGQMMGTVEYMSPEQGLDTHNVDIRSDIYSLGATLYKLLCGTAPFSGARYNTPGKILVALATEKPASIGAQRDDLPTGLIAVVDRMLAKDPAERYATPAEVARALAPFASGADLRRLADAARRLGFPEGVPTDKSLTPTEEHLSSPITGTVSSERWEGEAGEAPAEPQIAGLFGTREGEAPAEPQTAGQDGSAGASPSPNPTRRIEVGAIVLNAPRARQDKRVQPAPAVSYRHTAARRRRVAILAAVGLLAVFGIGILFGGQIIRIVTNKGQIVIETDGAGIEVVIKDGEGKVLDTETKREITFKAGEYNIEVTVKDSAGEQRFVTDHFTLTRNGKQTVDARWEVAKPMPTAESSDPDRRAAEWVLNVGGRLEIEFDGRYPFDLTHVTELPAGPFKVQRIQLYPPTKVDNAALENLRGLTGLDSGLALVDQPITDAGVERLTTIPGLANLRNISLIRTRITDVGVAHLKRFKNLDTLQLDGTQVTDAGLRHIGELPLVVGLYISGTAVTDSGLAHLRGLKLQTLHMYNCPGINGPGLEHLRAMTSLKYLILSNLPIGDDDLTHLRNLMDLELLDIQGTGVTEAGLSTVGRFKKLKTLALDGLPITDAGLKELLELPQLKVLGLRATKITDGGLEHLYGLKQVNEISVRHTKVTSDGVKKLHAALPRCKIDSDHGTFEPTASTDPDRRAAEWVMSIGGTIHIKENNQERQTGAVGDLPQGPFELTVVDLQQNPKVSDAGLAHFEDSKILTQVILDSTQVSDGGLAHFEDCKNLTVLDLRSTRVTDGGLGYFKDCKNLTTLFLSATRVSDAGLINFKDCKNLENLHLGYTEVTDAGLAFFKDRKNLTILHLAGARVTDAGLAHFKDCKNLTHLFLYDTPVTAAGLAHFTDCQNLVNIQLHHTQLGDAALPYLAGLPSLKGLTLEGTRISLRGHEQLKTALPKCQITWSETNRTVAESVLALGGTVEIGTPGQPESRPINAAVDLPRDYFQVRRVSLAGVVKPLDKLPDQLSRLRFPEFDRLESLDLSGITGLNYDFLVPIHGLRELTLANAGLNDVSLANLPKLPALKRLVLDGNGIRGTGLASLKEQPELIDLSLGCPTLTDLTAKNLAELKQLKRLSLAGSGLSDAGIKHLAGLMNLEALDLRRTKATAAGVAELKIALAKCKIDWDGAP